MDGDLEGEGVGPLTRGIPGARAHRPRPPARHGDARRAEREVSPAAARRAVPRRRGPAHDAAARRRAGGSAARSGAWLFTHPPRLSGLAAPGTSALGAGSAPT